MGNGENGAMGRDWNRGKWMERTIKCGVERER